jgi:membrane protein YdbS with pleckstrin-like domain
MNSARFDGGLTMSKDVETASRWMYRGLWAVIVNWLRVPADPPSLPAHASENVQSIHPADGYLRYLKFWFWIILLVTDIALTVGYIAAAIALIIEGLWWVALLLLPPALFIIIAPDIIAFVAIHLKYDTMWYVMTDRSIRIRRGIWIIHEVTITFENVQNLKVQQGPLQRHFGIANLIIETAGAGASSGKHGATVTANQGVIEGVSEEVARNLRDRILVKMRASKSVGLGDDDEVARPSGFSPTHLVLLREIRAEIAGLGSRA